MLHTHTLVHVHCVLSMCFSNIWPVLHMPFIEVDIFLLLVLFSPSFFSLVVRAPFTWVAVYLFKFCCSHGYISIWNSTSFQCRQLLHHFIFRNTERCEWKDFSTFYHVDLWNIRYVFFFRSLSLTLVVVFTTMSFVSFASIKIVNARIHIINCIFTMRSCATTCWGLRQCIFFLGRSYSLFAVPVRNWWLMQQELHIQVQIEITKEKKNTLYIEHMNTSIVSCILFKSSIFRSAFLTFYFLKGSQSRRRELSLPKMNNFCEIQKDDDFCVKRWKTNENFPVIVPKI